MNRLCARRRRWTRVSTWIATFSAIAVVANELWIVLFAADAHAAVNGLAVLVMWVALASCAVVVVAVLRVTESPAVTAILNAVATVKPEPLRLVEGQRDTV